MSLSSREKQQKIEYRHNESIYSHLSSKTSINQVFQDCRDDMSLNPPQRRSSCRRRASSKSHRCSPTTWRRTVTRNSRSWVCCGLVDFLRIVFQRLQPAFDVRRATAAVVSDADPLAGSPDSSRCLEAWRPDTRAYRRAGDTSADRDGNRPPMALVRLQSPPCHRPGRGARRPVRCSLVVLEGGVPRRPVKSSRGHKPACADERRRRTERFDDGSPDSTWSASDPR